MRARMRLLPAITLIGVTPILADSLELAPVQIEAQNIQPPASNLLSVPPDRLDPSVQGDAGRLLRAIPGLSGSRMGGIGIDPIIRGQSQNRLNILIDGAYGFGGCPNRMDPPTVYLDLDATDGITVIKGSQSVLYGGGGSGGTILLERASPLFEDGSPPQVILGVGTTGNSDALNTSLDVAAGNARAFGRANFSRRSAQNYHDGRGDPVRSAYTTEGTGVTLGYTPTEATRLELRFDRTHDYDVLFAGSGMDAPYSDSDQWRLRLYQDAPLGIFSALSAELYRIDVDHLMDNYSLRTQTAPRKMRVPSTSDTGGGRVTADLNTGALDWTLGLDYLQVDRDATRYWDLGSKSIDVPNSYLWPDVSRKDLGVFVQMNTALGAHDRIQAGLRYDHVKATISEARADLRPVGPAWVKSPNQLYEQYYGLRGGDRTEDNLGGLLGYERDLGRGFVARLGLSRSVRTADATERYLAANNMTAGARWIGNPDLEPEKHHQIELGLEKRGRPLQLTLDLFYDRVTDYILRDRAHGQEGILQDDGAAIYRNIDASLYGGELSGRYPLGPNLQLRASLAYTEAQNRTDDRPIAQIPPLNGTVGLVYTRDRWSIGGRITWAATQTRVDADPDTGSGLDVGETAGWWTLDLYGDWRLGTWGTLFLGVDNVFDRTYAYHVNRANLDPFNPNAVQVNEPGRTFWARTRLQF